MFKNVSLLLSFDSYIYISIIECIYVSMVLGLVIALCESIFNNSHSSL